MGIGATWTLPAFLNTTIGYLDARAASSPVQVATGKDGPILVVLQMAGGNDGLNTVVPFADDVYHRARPTLALSPDQVLRLNDYVGLHAHLEGIKALYDQGHVAIVQGVGYPNPNRSHFRSMEIWHTASDADRTEHQGWIGRYFDAACAGQPPTVGVNIGSTPPQAFGGDRSLGISLASPSRYQLMETTEGPGGLESMMRGEVTGDSGSQSGGSIEGLGAAAGAEDGVSNLEFLQRTALDAEISSEQIQRMVKGYQPSTHYPPTQLGEDLKLIAQLIAGGLPTRIYYAHLGGFDTHARQKPAHDRLMREFSEAMAAFCGDLKAQGNFDRVLVMTFSEFGRRVAENGSAGTDHGAAGPMFLFGGAVRAGLQGKAPSLTDLDRGDLRHQVDFRSVYATVLKGWLGADPLPILRRDFPLLDILRVT